MSVSVALQTPFSVVNILNLPFRLCVMLNHCGLKFSSLIINDIDQIFHVLIGHLSIFLYKVFAQNFPE